MRSLSRVAARGFPTVCSALGFRFTSPQLGWRTYRGERRADGIRRVWIESKLNPDDPPERSALVLDLDEHDWRTNDSSLQDGTRLLSAYVASNGERFWIITEADRNVTTSLLPDEY